MIAGFLWPEDKLREVGRLNGLLKKSDEKVSFSIMPEWFGKTNHETGEKYRHLQVTEIKNTADKLVLPLRRESVEKFDPEYPAVVFYEVERTKPNFLPRFLFSGK